MATIPGPVVDSCVSQRVVEEGEREDQEGHDEDDPVDGHVGGHEVPGDGVTEGLVLGPLLEGAVPILHVGHHEHVQGN